MPVMMCDSSSCNDTSPVTVHWYIKELADAEPQFIKHEPEIGDIVVYSSVHDLSRDEEIFKLNKEGAPEINVHYNTLSRFMYFKYNEDEDDDSSEDEGIQSLDGTCKYLTDQEIKDLKREYDDRYKNSHLELDSYNDLSPHLVVGKYDIEKLSYDDFVEICERDSTKHSLHIIDEEEAEPIDGFFTNDEMLDMIKENKNIFH